MLYKRENMAEPVGAPIPEPSEMLLREGWRQTKGGNWTHDDFPYACNITAAIRIQKSFETKVRVEATKRTVETGVEDARST